MLNGKGVLYWYDFSTCCEKPPWIGIKVELPFVLLCLSTRQSPLLRFESGKRFSKLSKSYFPRKPKILKICFYSIQGIGRAKFYWRQLRGENFMETWILNIEVRVRTAILHLKRNNYAAPGKLKVSFLMEEVQGGSRISHGGGGGAAIFVGGKGHQPLTWVLFGKNVCKNEIIGSSWVGGGETFVCRSASEGNINNRSIWSWAHLTFWQIKWIIIFVES